MFIMKSCLLKNNNDVNNCLSLIRIQIAALFTRSGLFISFQKVQMFHIEILPQTCNGRSEIKANAFTQRRCYFNKFLLQHESTKLRKLEVDAFVNLYTFSQAVHSTTYISLFYYTRFLLLSLNTRMFLQHTLVSFIQR